MANSPHRGRRSLGNWISLAARVGGTVIVFVIIARQIDLARVRDILGTLPLWFWPLAVGVVFLQSAIVGWRWQRIATALGTRLATAAAIRAVFVSAAINQCLPSFIGGDAYRVLIGRQAGMTLPVALHSVVLDRVSALLALVALVLLSAPFLLSRIPPGPVLYGFYAVLLAGLALLVLVAGGATLLGPLQRWAPLRHLVDLLQQARRILLGSTVSLAVLVLALLSHLCGSLILWIGVLALDVQLSLGDCIMIVPWVLLTVTIPLSIAGWGLREGAMVGALSLWGIALETALVLSLLLGVVGVVTGAAGLVWWLASGERPLQVLRQVAIEASEPGASG